MLRTAGATPQKSEPEVAFHGLVPSTVIGQVRMIQGELTCVGIEVEEFAVPPPVDCDLELPPGLFL